MQTFGIQVIAKCKSLFEAVGFSNQPAQPSLQRDFLG